MTRRDKNPRTCPFKSKGQYIALVVNWSRGRVGCHLGPVHVSMWHMGMQGNSILPRSNQSDWGISSPTLFGFKATHCNNKVTDCVITGMWEAMLFLLQLSDVPINTMQVSLKCIVGLSWLWWNICQVHSIENVISPWTWDTQRCYNTLLLVLWQIMFRA